jgi:hypothetical protein
MALDFVKDVIDAMPARRFPKLVKIIWKDAKCLNSSLTIEEVNKNSLIETISIGYLIASNDECEIISSTIFKELDKEDLNFLFDEGFLTFKDISFIPKLQIVKIIELKEIQ